MIRDWSEEERKMLIVAATLVLCVFAVVAGVTVHNYLELEYGVIEEYCTRCSQDHTFFSHCKGCGKQIKAEDHKP